MTLATVTGARELRDQARLVELEAVVERGLTSFIEVGEALTERKAEPALAAAERKLERARAGRPADRTRPTNAESEIENAIRSFRDELARLRGSE